MLRSMGDAPHYLNGFESTLMRQAVARVSDLMSSVSQIETLTTGAAVCTLKLISALWGVAGFHWIAKLLHGSTSVPKIMVK